jgi:hypothetical protein
MFVLQVGRGVECPGVAVRGKRSRGAGGEVAGEVVRYAVEELNDALFIELMEMIR